MHHSSSPNPTPQGNPNLSAQPDSPRLPSLAPASDLISAHVANRQLAGAVLLVAQNGTISHLDAIGYADLASRRPMDTDAIFRVHSMTKAVTSAAALILADRHLLDLDSPVSQYLPALADLKVHSPDGPVTPRREMSVRDLMRHTSGLTYPFIANGPVERAYRHANLTDRSSTLSSMVENLGQIPLAFQPGENWGYSIATDVLGHLIEIVSASPLDSFLDSEILRPLGMSDTAFHVPPEKLHRLPACYATIQSGRLVETDPASGSSQYAQKPALLSGGGGLVSTATDFFRFLEFLLRGGTSPDGTPILSQNSVRLLTTDQLPQGVRPTAFDGRLRSGFGFSLGLTVCTSPSSWDPHARIGEFGWGGAASTHFWASPADRLSVIILQQTMPFSYSLEHALKPLIYAAFPQSK